MKALFTGATGLIGRQAIPRLIEAGHDVTGVARSDEGRAWLQQAGARPIRLDLFERDEVDSAVAGHDVVLHFATAIPSQAEMTKRESWELNDRLRSGATANLVDAALRYDVSGFIQESITFFYADGGDRWLDESAPIDPWWDILDSALDAERHLDRFTDAGGTGVSLRLAWLYGPGRTSAEHLAGVAGRKIPIVGRGNNYISHLHVEDAGTAVAAALGAAAGSYNVSEDDPVTAREDMEALVDALGAGAPRRVPRWLARMIAGPSAGLLWVSQRVSNERFKKETGWAPSYRSVREGWSAVVSTSGGDRR
jgi:nucleoside-diphosphate-sugar epimerase